MKKLFNYLKALFSNIFRPKPKKYEPITNVKFGWKKDVPDPRDIKYKVTAPKILPKIVDLRPFMPPIYNQNNLGSCTANALGGAFQFEQRKQKKQDFMPSRLFIYYNERALEGSINNDDGACIRTGIKTLAKDGVCPEIIWPYIEEKFRDKPSADCYKVALDNQVLKYLRISPHNLYDVKQCLADGFPIVCGIILFESFMTEKVAKTGIVPMPSRNENPIGGHAIMIVGYDDSKQSVIIRNSWGAEWGIKGYCYLPYAYINSPTLSSDYWTIRLVE